jgi:hypothetical protein
LNLDSVGAIFERVILGDGFRRQFLGLAREQSRRRWRSQRWREDEAAGLDAEHLIHLEAGIALFEGVDDAGESGRILQQRGDVVEQNARWGSRGFRG